MSDVPSRPAVHGVIFDMDGVLLDTERLGLTLWHESARKFDIPFSEELYRLMIGRTVQDTLAELRQGLPAETPVEEFVEDANNLYLDYIRTKPMPVKTGVREALTWLTERGAPVAVATSTGTEKAHLKLQKAGLDGFFSHVVCGDQVPRGKPAPDIFLEAASRLDLEPSACVVFEDSAPGLAAAHAAGCLPVLIPDLYPPTDTMRNHARFELASAGGIPAFLRDQTRLFHDSCTNGARPL